MTTEKNAKSASLSPKRTQRALRLTHLVAPIILILVGVQHFITYDGDYDISFAESAIDKLVDTCGVRIVGTAANELCAVRVLTEKLREIGIDKQHMEVMTSKKGSMYLDFISGINVVYDEIHNIAVRMPGRTLRSGDDSGACNAILMGTHFDSSFGSPGKTDDGAGVGLMLDFVRRLKEDPADMDIIFFFNGAEEAILPGSHSFVKQHRWFKNVCGFINLESLGPMGREVLFQVDSRWILEAYQKAAPQPYFNSVCMSVFASGLIPGDTDYRIYKNEGHIPGVDFANIGGSWRYHTGKDNYHYLPSLRHYAGNTYALMREMATSVKNDKHLEGDQDVLGRLTFIDVFGIPLIIHLHLLNAIAVLILLWNREREIRKNILEPMLTILLSALLSLVPGLCTLAITDIFGVPTQHAHVVNAPIFTGLIAAPALLTCMHFGPDKSPSTLYVLIHVIIAYASPAMLLCSSVLIGFALFAPLGLLVYAPTIYIFTNLMGHMANRTGSELPLALFLHISYAVIISFGAVGLGGMWLPRITSRSLYIKLLGAVYTTTVLLSVVLPQYTDDIPMRVFAQRVLNADTDVTSDFIIGMDRNRNGRLFESLSTPSKEWKDAEVACGDGKKIYGYGLPYPLPVYEIMRHGRCREVKNASGSELFPYGKAEVTYKMSPDVDRGSKLSIDIQFGDATQLIVTLPGTVTEWSLDHEVPPPRRACDCHYILIINGGVSHDEKWDTLWTNTSAPIERVRKDRRVNFWVKNATGADVSANYVDKGEIVQNFNKAPIDAYDKWPQWALPIFWYSHQLPSYPPESFSPKQGKIKEEKCPTCNDEP